MVALIALFTHLVDALVAKSAVRAERFYAKLAFIANTALAKCNTVLAIAAALAKGSIRMARFAIGTVIFEIAISAAFGTAVVAARAYPVVAAALAAIIAIDELIPSTNVIMRLGDKSAKHNKAKHDADYLGEIFFHLGFPSFV